MYSLKASWLRKGRHWDCSMFIPRGVHVHFVRRDFWELPCASLAFGWFGRWEGGRRILPSPGSWFTCVALSPPLCVLGSNDPMLACLCGLNLSRDPKSPRTTSRSKFHEQLRILEAHRAPLRMQTRLSIESLSVPVFPKRTVIPSARSLAELKHPSLLAVGFEGRRVWKLD
jgi:hypothetical protein